MKGSSVLNEKRRARRLPIIAKVKWSEAGEDRYCQTKDISQTGAFLVSNELPVIGKTLDLEIAVPQKGEAIQLRARIIRHEPGDNFTGRQRGFAVDFIDMGSSVEDVLKQLENNPR